MTKKDYEMIARAIAHTELAGKLDYSQQSTLRNTFAMALWQKDKKFDFGKFEDFIKKVHNEIYQDFLEDQTH